MTENDAEQTESQKKGLEVQTTSSADAQAARNASASDVNQAIAANPKRDKSMTELPTIKDGMTWADAQSFGIEMGDTVVTASAVLSVETMQEKAKEALAAAQKPPQDQVLIASNIDDVANTGKEIWKQLTDATNATDASEAQKEVAELHKTVDGIRASGMLTAPDRTGDNDVEYKMVFYTNGSASKAYKNVKQGTDPKTHSDIYVTDPKLIAEMAGNGLLLNRVNKLVHSHPNKHGMEPYAFSKEDIVESNSAVADSYLLGPDGRLFVHKAVSNGDLMRVENITDEMRKPDKCLGKFDDKGKFHRAIYKGQNVTFEDQGF